MANNKKVVKKYEQKKNKKNVNKKLIIIIIIAVVLLAGIVTTVSIVSGSNNGKKDNKNELKKETNKKIPEKQEEDIVEIVVPPVAVVNKPVVKPVMIPVVTPVVAEEEKEAEPIYVDVSTIIESQSESFKDTYYNKFNSTNLEAEDIDDSIYYINLGDYKGEANPSKLVINGNKYGIENNNISIGNNSYIKVPTFKISNGKLLVALPWMVMDALPSNLSKVEIGGQIYEVKMYVSGLAENTLSIDSVAAKSQTGYISNISVTGEKEVTYEYGHMNSLIGIVLENEGNNIVDTEQIIFRKASNGMMGMTTPESVNGTEVTYALYPGYGTTAIGTSSSTQRVYKLAVPGKGVIELILNLNAKNEKDGGKILDVSSTITTQSDSIKTTYYNKYNSTTIDATLLNDTVYYINLGEYLGAENPTSLKINGNSYTNENYSLSIGNNAYINVPIFKISNGNLLVALPWMVMDALPTNFSKVEISGQTFTVKLYSNSLANNTLSIEDVLEHSSNGSISEVGFSENHVTYRYDYMSNYIGLVLSYNGSNITNASQLIFRKDANGYMGMTTPELMDGENVTYALYPKYGTSAVSTSSTTNKTYKLAVPGIGTIEVLFTFEAVAQ